MIQKQCHMTLPIAKFIQWFPEVVRLFELKTTGFFQQLCDLYKLQIINAPFINWKEGINLPYKLTVWLSQIIINSSDYKKSDSCPW